MPAIISIPTPVMAAMPPQLIDMLYRVREIVSADVLHLLALLWLFLQFRGFFGFVYDHTLKGTKNFKKSYGSWAVVTGATDGIGLAMAHEFAKKGLNIVLLSRTKEKLNACAKEISEKCPNIEVKVLAIDFSDINDPAVRTQISKFLSPLEVGVLVNNVGVSYPFPKYFNELTDSEVEALTVLNVDSTVWMTRIVLDGMMSRKRGAIINIASAAGVLTSPLLAQYGGAKGYVAQFSRALHYELASKGIHVQCQVPLYVTTKLAKLRNASLTVATPAQYARAALKAIGGGPVVSPYWSHAIQMSLFNTLPEWLVASVTNNMHIGIRRAGLKKEEQKKSEIDSSSKKGK